MWGWRVVSTLIVTGLLSTLVILIIGLGVVAPFFGSDQIKVPTLFSNRPFSQSSFASRQIVT